MKATTAVAGKVGIIKLLLLVVFLALLQASCALGSWQQQQTSSSSQHHNHNAEGFEGRPSSARKVRRLQRLLLHNNRHTMQFRTEDDEEQGTLL